MTGVRTPSRILLVGGGGREHALAWRLAGAEIVAAPGSDAIARLPGVRRVDVDPTDGPALAALAADARIDLAIVGPEAPLAAGVADALVGAGVPTFGPTAAAARVETSKAYCHEIAAAAGVRMARGRAFAALEPARAYAAALAREAGGGVVVKADGLAAGKGVTVCDSIEEADAALAVLWAGEDGTTAATDDPPRVVVEERLMGPEASVIALADGRDALALPAARDHKRLLDGDRGPNTGGMGAYSPLPDLPDEVVAGLVDAIHRPLLAELARRGRSFRGALYAGLILTADGPVLLECNARFGDPETQVLLPRLDVPLAPLLLAAAEGRLAAAAAELGIRGSSLPATPDTAVGIVLAAAGYPDAPRRGEEIHGLDAAAAAGGLLFHAGTVEDADGAWRTAGGRILAVVGRGIDLAAARVSAERAADVIRFEGMQRRHDIGVALDEPLAVGSTP